jgi:hypothetical protein
VPAQSGRNVGPHGISTSAGVRQIAGPTAEVRRQANLDRPDGPNGERARGGFAFDRRQRSAYGIHNSFDKAAGPSPWPVRFIEALSERSAQIRARYWSQSNTGQIPGTGDGYADKLQTQWRRGSASGGTRADPIVQNAQIPTTMADWPNSSGSSPGMQKRSVSWYGMDARNPNLVNGRRPMNLPRFEAGQIRLHSETSQRAGEYLPTRFAVNPPMRIVRMHRYGTGMMAGSQSFGTRQTWGQGEDCIVVAPPQLVKGMKSRGIISARGMLSPKQGTGRERIPAIFTPSSIQ